MYYYRIISTGEVLGAGQSSAQDAEWIERYAVAVGIAPEDVEEFEAEEDPRPPDARVEIEQPAPEEPDVEALIAQEAKRIAAVALLEKGAATKEELEAALGETLEATEKGSDQ